MASKTAPKTAQKSNQRQPVRQSITLELVRALTPSETKAETMASTFGLEPVHHAGIREKVEEHMVRIANELRDNLNDKAMAMFLQRIVGSFVQAAHGAAIFYGKKKSEAMALHNKLLNDHRDEDRDGVIGFESRADRAASFAAEMGLQASSLLAAAEGAVYAYVHMTGDDWKPYEGTQSSGSVERKASEAQMAALAD
jgi:phage terminase large subunit-like protein